jgi:hypothetical protein
LRSVYAVTRAVYGGVDKGVNRGVNVSENRRVIRRREKCGSLLVLGDDHRSEWGSE